MCEGNSVEKEKKKEDQDRMCKRNSQHKKEASMGCIYKETPDIELFLKRLVSSVSLSLCVSRFVCFFVL